MLRQIAPDILEIMAGITVNGEAPDKMEIMQHWRNAAKTNRPAPRHESTNPATKEKGTA